MTAEEFILDKWYSCVAINHKEEPGNIFMVHDPIWLRQKKLSSLSYDDTEIKYNKTIDTKILFYLDYKHHMLNIDYTIWSLLDKKYNLSKNDCDAIIKKTIPEYYILKFGSVHIQSVSLNNKLINNSI